MPLWALMLQRAAKFGRKRILKVFESQFFSFGKTERLRARVHRSRVHSGSNAPRCGRPRALLCARPRVAAPAALQEVFALFAIGIVDFFDVDADTPTTRISPSLFFFFFFFFFFFIFFFAPAVSCDCRSCSRNSNSSSSSSSNDGCEPRGSRPCPGGPPPSSNSARGPKQTPPLTLYDSMARTKRAFEPRAGREGEPVSMYVCGVTVYDFSHVGKLVEREAVGELG